jgi:hypothetical protein
MRKLKQNKTPEFVIFSEDGFFTGLANGGQPQWSMDINNDKVSESAKEKNKTVYITI